MQTKMSNVSVRMPTELKEQLEPQLHNIGLNMTTFVNMAGKQFLIQGKLPFEVYSDYVFPQSVYDALDRATEARKNGTAVYYPAEMVLKEIDDIIAEVENGEV